MTTAYCGFALRFSFFSRVPEESWPIPRLTWCSDFPGTQDQHIFHSAERSLQDIFSDFEFKSSLENWPSACLCHWDDSTQ